MQASLLADLEDRFGSFVDLKDKFVTSLSVGRFRLFQPNFLPATKCGSSAKPREGTFANYSITDRQTCRHLNCIGCNK